MANVNSCLKRLFTFFNILFAIVGGVIITLALLSQAVYSSHGGQDLEGRTTALIVLYVLGSLTMVIAIVGAYGAQKESKVALIVFLVCMVIGSLMMLKVGVPSAIARPQLEEVLEQKFRQVLPLDQAADNIKNMANALQASFHCCGLFSYRDWENNIPESCMCNREEVMEGKCQTTRNLVLQSQGSVYTQTCFPIVMHYVAMAADIMLGVVFTLAVLALLGMVLSSLMIHQIRTTANRPTIVLTVPAVFTPQPPKYQELYNAPEY